MSEEVIEPEPAAEEDVDFIDEELEPED